MRHVKIYDNDSVDAEAIRDLVRARPREPRSRLDLTGGPRGSSEFRLDNRTSDSL